jgi:hypothetical protein
MEIDRWDVWKEMEPCCGFIQKKLNMTKQTRAEYVKYSDIDTKRNQAKQNMHRQMPVHEGAISKACIYTGKSVYPLLAREKMSGRKDGVLLA